jgi:tellurite resistance protein TerC
MNTAYIWAKRIVITIVGFTVLGLGIAMLVLPGPAFIVIPVGLGILGLEFAWARRWLIKVRAKGEELARAAWQRTGGKGPPDRPPPDQN